MASQSVELINPLLGLDPYVLIECKPDPDPDSEAGFTLNVRAGGGVSSRDELACLLLLAVEEITAVSTDLYVQQVDVARSAAGVAPLSGAMSDRNEG